MKSYHVQIISFDENGKPESAKKSYDEKAPNDEAVILNAKNNHHYPFRIKAFLGTELVIDEDVPYQD
jgi:hypothetical protein